MMDNQIILKSFNIPGATVFNELAKLEEEIEEFRNGVLNEDSANTIEEFFDVIQVLTNILNMEGYDLNLVAGRQIDHFIKLENRGWIFNE